MVIVSRIVAFVAAVLMASAAAAADDYPSRTVRVIVPFAAGGPADVYARQLAQYLGEALKQPFVVEATTWIWFWFWLGVGG